MAMEDRNSKRARNRGGVDYANFASDAMRGGGGGPGKPLAGCHLEVGVATTHLFPGQAVCVQVKLLNDEDRVQKITRDIDVTVTGENNKVPPPPGRAQSTAVGMVTSSAASGVWCAG